MNRDGDTSPRSQPDASGPGAAGGAGRNGGEDGGDDDRRDYGRRRHRHRYYYPDDTQPYGTSRTGARTQGGGAQRSRLQDECDRGYRDGLRAGEKDARRGLSSDPQRSGLYRTGGETINRAGRTADAKEAYRDCFLRGYEEAYKGFNLNPGGANPRN